MLYKLELKNLPLSSSQCQSVDNNLRMTSILKCACCGTCTIYIKP